MGEYLILGLDNEELQYILHVVNTKKLMPLEVKFTTINFDLVDDESIRYLDAQTFSDVKAVFVKNRKVPDPKITNFIARYFLYLSDKVYYV